MTNVIDHAISIPSSAPHVWQIVGNLEQNSRWQVNCKSLSYLSSLRRSVGTRWRMQTSAKDQVLEITAWYENLGYEYTIVEGVNFQAFKGRVRLQEVVEGTVVQWTISYELGGVLGGLRNSISLKRSLDTEIVESLRRLYKLCKDTGVLNPRDVKSLMRDAPSVEERTTYRPRQTSDFKDEASAPAASFTPLAPPQPVPVLSRLAQQEPPVVEEDTKPNQAPPIAPAVLASHDIPVTRPAATTATPAPSVGQPEPGFLKELPPLLSGSLGGKESTPSPDAPIRASIVEPPIPSDAPIAIPALPPGQASRDTSAMLPSTPAISSSAYAALQAPQVEDSAQINIFELFGLPKPSETQEIRAAISAQTPSPELSSLEDTGRYMLTYKRVGLRLALRAKRYKLRLPSPR